MATPYLITLTSADKSVKFEDLSHVAWMRTLRKTVRRRKFRCKVSATIRMELWSLATSRWKESEALGTKSKSDAMHRIKGRIGKTDRRLRHGLSRAKTPNRRNEGWTLQTRPDTLQDLLCWTRIYLLCPCFFFRIFSSSTFCSWCLSSILNYQRYVVSHDIPDSAGRSAEHDFQCACASAIILQRQRKRLREGRVPMSSTDAPGS
jgi:hypothetical protein